MEFPVNPESAPFLISSTRSVLWIERAHDGRVRVAARKVEGNSLMLEIVRAVQKRGAEEAWGNSFPLTMEGFTQAKDYLSYFGIPEVEVLLNAENDLWEAQQGPVRTLIPWLPAGLGVVVPLDRAYLGFQSRTPANRLLALVHNPSRGMAILGI